jgi:HNH endonuclease
VADAPGTYRLACGTVLAPETARRLACDQQVAALHHTDGHARGSGLARRFASPRLNRLLDHRDRGCRFPGCTHSRHLHTHHIVHWAHGGTTTPDNLLRLCSRHHRLVHEGGYSITGHPTGELTFHRPDGRRIHQHPPTRTGDPATLTHLNHRHHINPGPATITPDWTGETLDLDWAITVLLDNHPHAPDPPATNHRPTQTPSQVAQRTGALAGRLTTPAPAAAVSSNSSRMPG